MLAHSDEAILVSCGLSGLVWGGGGLGVTCRGVGQTEQCGMFGFGALHRRLHLRKCSGLTGDWSKVEGAWLSPVTGSRKISIDGSQRNVCLTLVGKDCSGNWREDVRKTTGRNESGMSHERVRKSCFSEWMGPGETYAV